MNHPTDPAGLYAGFTVATLVMIGLTFAIVTIVLTLVVHWRIAAKAGYPGALSLLMLIPFANIVILLVFAFSKWPIEEALEQAYAAQYAAGARPTF